MVDSSISSFSRYLIWVSRKDGFSHIVQIPSTANQWQIVMLHDTLEISASLASFTHVLVLDVMVLAPFVIVASIFPFIVDIKKHEVVAVGITEMTFFYGFSSKTIEVCWN
jgi:predicted neutral ceramidase superfamily lipid hydrolase